MPEQPQPYIGPRAFKPEDAPFFFGRDREANELLSLVISHAEVLLYAQSGAGKTSLINAKLLSLLEKGEGLEVLPLATMRGPPSTLPQSEIANIYVFNTLVSWTKGAAAPEKLAKMTLREFLEQRGQPMDKEGLPKPCVAIFDQFEELFTSYREHWEQRRGFFEQVRDALDANPRLRTLFAMRDDYVAAIDRYARIMPEEFRIRFHLENLREPQALDAIKGPLTRDERHHFAQGVAEKLVKELMKTPVETASGQTESITGEFVEPIMLQVVCERLWRDLKPEETEITFAHLETISVEKALLGFYEESIQAVALETGIAEGTLRSWFEKHLVTPAGTRGMVFRGETETEGLRNDAVDALDKLHLIRSELRGGAQWYELTHDRFIEAIQRSNEVWFEQRAVSEALRSKLEAKAQIPGAFLDESETRDAEAFLTSPDARILGPSPQVESLVRASRLHVEEEKASKARELEDARRLAESEHARAEVRSRLARRAVVFALAACGAAAFSIYEWQNATKMRQQAEIQGLASYLTAEALKHQKDQLDLSLLLSIEAYRVARTMHPSTEKLRLMKSRLLADAKSSLLAGLVSSSHLLRFAHGRGEAIRSIVSTKDGRLIITGSTDGTVIGWNSSGIPVTQPLRQHTGNVYGLALSPNERTLASASADGTILVWDVTAMQKKPLRLNAEQDRADAGVYGIDFSPDGKSIVSASLNGAITLWDVASRRRIDSVPAGHGKSAYRAIFNPAGDLIASCGANNVVKLWKIESGRLVLFKELAGHVTQDKESRFVGHPEGKEIFNLAFSPDGSILVSAGQEGTVVRWRLTESEPVAEPLHDEKSETAHGRGVYGLAFSSDGKIIASGSADQTIRFWDAATGEAIKTDFTGYGQTIYCLAFCPQKENTTGILLAGTATGAFTMWEPTQEQATLSDQTGLYDWVRCVRFDSSGRKMASCVEKNGAIFLTDLTTFDSEELKGHSERVQSFAFAPDGRTYAAGAVDGKLLLWDSAPGAAPNSLNAIPSLPWDSAPGAARSDLDAILSQPIYVLPLLEPIYVLPIYVLPISQPIYVLPISEPIYALAYTPDSKILVSGGPADQILVWDVSSRKLLRRLERNGSKRVLALAFSPDGRRSQSPAKIKRWRFGM
ncbi:MAG: WD domain, G-beta repeat [Candidatus Udaeobacter sp.]|nr:MAG: WD domain, G-beta repeat [Candidatus Udaeobacter sp.]